ncbi:hypothetical protein VBH15_04845 [Vagococcus fluvialis]|uniref:hypothetical protein n=1 Tax=Vagococcus fluvialis TaxID=2738 RepID=UPI0037D1501D
MEEGKERFIQYNTVVDTETGEHWKSEEKPFKQKRVIDPIEKPVTVPRRGDGRTFTSIKLRQYSELIDRLSTTQLGHLLLLSSYQRYDTGILYLDDQAKIPMSIVEISEVLCKSELTSKRLIKSLMDYEAIYEVKVTYGKNEYEGFKVCNEFFYKGASPSRNETLNSIKQYIEEIREVYVKNGAASTGWLSKLLPFVDRQTNFICFNPNREVLYEELDSMTRKDIEQATNAVKRDVSLRIRTMQIHGYMVFAEIVTGGGYRKIKLNPLIYNRMSGDVSRTVLKDFTIK